MYAPTNIRHRRYTIAGMMEYEVPDTTGKRIQWGIDNLPWGTEQQPKTNKEFAEYVGIGYVYLSKIVNDDKTPAPETMRKIARALGVSRAFLEMETRYPDPLDAEPGYTPPR